MTQILVPNLALAETTKEDIDVFALRDTRDETTEPVIVSILLTELLTLKAWQLNSLLPDTFKHSI